MVDHNPMQEFQKWFYEADTLYDEYEPNAMSLTTIGIDNYPKSRVVLLKKYTWEGFIFYTNYNSDKGMAITKNPNVSLLFNWVNSKRMVQVLGIAEKVSKEESDTYFNLRPRESQLGAWTSHQSCIVTSRQELKDNFKFQEDKFKNQPIPRPDHWGGYIVKPHKIHFYEKLTNNYTNEEIYVLNPEYDWSKTHITYLTTN